METFVIYLLKTGMWIGIFWLIYWLFLSRETFFRFNRYFLLAGLFLSFVIPLIQLRYTVNIEAPVSFDAPATRAEELSAGASFNWLFVLLAVYSCGIVVISLRYWVGLRKLAGLLATQPVRKINSFHIVDSPDLRHPFSIFKYIFINSRVTPETAQMMILEHEQTHIRQRHWLDLAAGNMVCILQWFNPFAWLFVDAVKQNHEYLADQSVLQSGYSPDMYQTVLLSHTLNVHAPVLVHSFVHAGKVNRFRMMKKTASNPLRKGAALMVFPALTVFLWAFAQPVYVFDRQDAISSKKTEEQVIEIRITDMALEANPPLILLNGAEIPYSTMNTINPDDIQSISVLKESLSVAVYGETGENGVVLIHTKEQTDD